MSDILHSFGCGIAFAIGAFVGVIITTVAWANRDKEGREESRKHVEEHWKCVEERLAKSLIQHAASAEALARIADASEGIVNRKGGEK